MRTTIVIDDLIREAKQYSSAETPSGIVNEALRVFIQTQKQRMRDQKRKSPRKQPE